jgi:hypothetical protein
MPGVLWKMTYYERKTREPFVSTAIYPNRVRDKEKLENACDLIEGGSARFIFKTAGGLEIAQGYIRITYGDHGPYIEFLPSQIEWSNLICERKDLGYYNKWYTKTGRVLVYEQLRTVANLPNPPAGRYSFRGNRKEGYADYRVGRVYVSPYDVVINRAM